MNLTEVVAKIKSAGKDKVRIVAEDSNQPMAKQLIQVMENGCWVTILSSPEKQLAEKVVGQAVNRVILG